MHADNSKTAVLEAALLVLLGFLWGIPYALNKVSLATIPPMTGVAARVSLAAIALWVIVFASEVQDCRRAGISFRAYLFKVFIACVIPYTLIAYWLNSRWTARSRRF